MRRIAARITNNSQKRGIKMRNILIGGAWPYANGSPHIGHIAALLPGDVLARYHRAAGDNVYFVSGSDCQIGRASCRERVLRLV